METMEETINKNLCKICTNKCEKCLSIEIIKYSNYIQYKCLNYERKNDFNSY